MKNKKYLLLIPVVALGLTACQDPTTTTTTSDPGSTTTTSEPDPTTTTTEPPAPVGPTAEEVLTLLQGDLALSGTLSITQTTTVTGYPGYEDPITTASTSSIKTFVSETEYVLSEVDAQTGSVIADEHYFAGTAEQELEGVLTSEVLNYDNTVGVLHYSYNESGDDVMFVAEYYNPFILLEESAITISGDTATIDVTEIGAEVMYILTGYTNPVETMTVTLSDGALSSVAFDIAFEDSAEISEGVVMSVSGTASYEASFVTAAEAGSGHLQPMATLPEHAKLKEAIAKVQTGNYTINTVDHDIADPTTVYAGVTAQISDDGAIFYKTPKEGETVSNISGYLAGGTAEEPTLTPITAETLESEPVQDGGYPVLSLSMDDYRAPFNIAAELFVPTEEANTFVVSADLYNGYIANDIVSYNYYSSMYDGTYGAYLDGTLTISFNDDLSEITVSIDYEDQYGVSRITDTITNIGTTTLPFTLDDIVVLPTTWDEFDPDLAGVLDTFVGDADLIPFVYYEYWSYAGQISYNAIQIFGPMFATQEEVLEWANSVLLPAFIDDGWTFSQEEQTLTKGNITVAPYIYYDSFNGGYCADLIIYNNDIPMPTTWEEVDPELASALTTLFDGEDVVPFMYETWALNTWDSNEYQVLFDSAAYTSSERRDELMAAYGEVLIAAGFTSTEEGVYTKDNVEITLSTDDIYASWYGYYFTVTVTNLDKEPEPVDVTSALTTWAAIDEKYGTNIVEALEAIFGEGNADTIPALDVDSEWIDQTANQSYYDFIAFCTLPAGTQWDSQEVYDAFIELINAKLTEAGFTTTDGYEYVKGNIKVYFDTYSQISFMVVVSDSTAE